MQVGCEGQPYWAMRGSHHVLSNLLPACWQAVTQTQSAAYNGPSSMHALGSKGFIMPGSTACHCMCSSTAVAIL